MKENIQEITHIPREIETEEKETIQEKEGTPGKGDKAMILMIVDIEEDQRIEETGIGTERERETEITTEGDAETPQRKGTREEGEADQTHTDADDLYKIVNQIGNQQLNFNISINSQIISTFSS